MSSIVVFLAVILALGITNGLPSKTTILIPDIKVVEVNSTNIPIAIVQKYPQGRIFKGEPVIKQSNFKYQVRLQTEKGASTFGCGGAIISKRVVLTASHCLENGIRTTVYFGLLDHNKLDEAQHQTVEASNFRMNENYNKVTLENDIGLILLDKDIEFSENVGPVALPPPNECKSFGNQDVVISGWGMIDDINPRPNILQYKKVRTALPSGCSFYSYLFKEKTMICADATLGGTCQGDSGGPMVMKYEGTPTVIGCVSYGVKNCGHTINRVFTCIASYLDWIKSTGAGYL